MANNYTTLSLEAVKFLTGLIRDMVSVGEAIDDLHIRSDGTWSSVKIDTLIKQCLQDSNDYTDRLVANLSRLELKLVTSESEITQPNTMYLYKPSGSTSYEQYVVIEGTKVLLGTTDIDMDNYYTITQADAKFVLQTDFDSLKTKVGGKVDKADIVDNLTSTDTDKPLSANQGKVLKDEVDLKANDSDVVKKTDISTTIDSTSTDTKVPSTKAVYDSAIKDKNIKTYYLLSQLGITTTPCTIKDIWDKMSVNSIAIIDTNSTIVTDLDYFKIPLNIASEQQAYGFLTIGKFIERTILEFRRSHALTPIPPETFIGYCVGNNCTSIQWKRMVITGINDVGWKELTLNSGVSGRVRYRIKNGICFVSIYALTSSTMSTNGQTITSDLPIPEITNNVWYTLGTSTDKNLLVYIDSTGVMSNNTGVNNEVYYGTFSYPVKES